MTNSKNVRISGLSLLTGALVFIVHVVLRSLITVTAGADPVAFASDHYWVPINLLGLVGAVLVLLGLPAVYGQMADRSGLIGFVGIALFAAAWMFFGLFLSLYSLLILPWLAENAPSLLAAPQPAALIIAFVTGLAAWIIGNILLAIPFLRKRAQPAWVGYALVTSAAWMVIGNLIIAPSGPASNLVVNLLSNLGPVFLLIGFGHLGYRMLSEQAPAVFKDSHLPGR